MHEVTDTAASLQLSAAGLGATVMTGLMRRLHPGEQLTALRMHKPLTRQIVLLSRDGAARRGAVRVFIDEAGHVVDELVASLDL